MDDAKPFREIEIDGTLLNRWQPKGSKYGIGGHCTVTRCVTVDSDVVRKIDEADASGIRRILLVVDSFGGWTQSAHVVSDRIERFRAGGGFVISYVKQADSSAPLVALSADYVVLDPEGSFKIHRADRPGDDRSVEHRRMADALYRRTGIVGIEGLMGEALFTIDARIAPSWCFADEIGTLERARQMAAGAPRLETDRSRRVAAVIAAASPVDAPDRSAAAMSSESTLITTELMWSEIRRIERSALRNLTMRSTTGGLYGVAHGPAGFIAIGVSSTCLKSVTGEEFASSPITSGSYRAIVYDDTHDRYIAVGLANACSVTADGGTSWAAKTIPAGWYYAATLHGSRVIAAGWTGSTAAVVTTDNGGDTWTSRTFGRNLTISGIASNGSRVVAVGLNVSDGFASYSDDGGVTWTAHDFPPLAVSGFLPVAVTATNTGGWLSVGSGGSAMTWTGDSADPWVKRPMGQDAELTAVIRADQVVVAIESNPDADRSYMFTAGADGRAWETTLELIPRRGFNAGAWSGRVLCLVGYGVATSAPV